MRIWLLIGFVGLLIIGLHEKYPHAVASFDERMRILYLLLFLLLVGGGWGLNRLSSPKAWQYAVIWLAIIMALVLVYYGLLALQA
jgi:hypothetical protein